MALKETAANSTGYLQLIRGNRAFRHLWAGQIISLTGDWFNLIASAALIAALTQSGTAIGGLFVVRMVAPFIVSPIAGVVADRYNRRAIVISTDVLRCFIVLAFVLVREPQHVWLIYALTAVQSASQGFYFPAWNAILPDITERRELGIANAISSATWSVMLSFGAALGGLVAGVIGVYPAFVIDAITFLLSAIILFRMPYQSTLERAADQSIMAGLRQYMDGLAYLRRHIDTFSIAIQKAILGFCIIGFFQVAQVTIAEQHFPIGEGGSITMGLIYVMAGIGSGLSPILGRNWARDRDRRLRLMIALGYISAAVGFLVCSSLLSLPVVLFGALMRGVGGGLIWILGTQLLLQIVPNEVRGRVFSTEFALYTLCAALSSGATGRLIDTSLGVGGVLLLGSFILVLPTALWLLWIFFGRRDLVATQAA
ncbi:MAG: MFS transporter [Chloroflexota bacterium]|nr:MFS transporter [Chloroflexota bacterium]MDE2945509.1 MFS transporter [Chloroflexota bacterium]